MIRLHRNLVEAAAATLARILTENEPADRAVEQLLCSNPRWGARDRRMLAESIYETLRDLRRLAVAAEVTEPVHDEAALQRMLLARHLLAGGDCPPWAAADAPDADRVRARAAAPHLPRAVISSIPDWLDALGVAELGKARWTRELAALRRPALLCLRHNPRRCTAEALDAWLGTEGHAFERVTGVPEARVLPGRPALQRTAPYRDGWFEVQDVNSQRVARALEPAPGTLLVDLCAGAGGKALHLAALTQDRARIVALDVRADALEELRRRARRADATRITSRHIAPGVLPRDLIGRTDGVLVDAPCSGLGVLRRHPDVPWRLNVDELARLREQQAGLLHDGFALLRPGARLVYATCSILPSEGFAPLHALCAAEPAARVLSTETLWPSETDFDGFTVAVLERARR